MGPLLVVALLVLIGAESAIVVLGIGDGTVSVEPQAVLVNVGTSFSVDIWIRGLTFGMMAWGIDLTWDPNLISYVSYVGFAPNANWQLTVTSSSGKLEVGGSTTEQYVINTDHKWFTINFRCLATGVSQLAIPDNGWMDVGGFQRIFTARPGMVTQTSGSVGGFILTDGAVSVLARYLAVIGLVAIAAVAVKKRRN